MLRSVKGGDVNFIFYSLVMQRKVKNNYRNNPQSLQNVFVLDEVELDVISGNESRSMKVIIVIIYAQRFVFNQMAVWLELIIIQGKFF